MPPSAWYGRPAKYAVGVITAEHAYFQVTMIVPQATTAEPVQVSLWRGP